MTTFHARIRVPAAIDDAVAGPFAARLLQDPTDGSIVEQDGGAESGEVLVSYEADDVADAELHARLLAERAPGCVVENVDPAVPGDVGGRRAS